jgi:hypothetical protein
LAAGLGCVDVGGYCCENKAVAASVLGGKCVFLVSSPASIQQQILTRLRRVRPRNLHYLFMRLLRRLLPLSLRLRELA